MIPDPSTADTPVGEGGSGGPAGNAAHARSRSGHHCSSCGQPIEDDVWDMTVFATQTTVAYLPCLWAAP
jgi:hypothetical protein